VDDVEPSDGERLSDSVPWEPWRPEEVARRFAGTRIRWYVVAGWALDLFRGGQSRDHEDIEIGVPTADFPLVQDALKDFELDIVGSGERWPVDNIAALSMHFQTWVREPATGVYLLDVFRDPHDGDTWICRRDRSIRMPYYDLVRFTPDGIPYMAPEVALLFKAKHLRDKDQADFDGVVGLLGDEQVSWLHDGLERIHPGHAWIDALAAR